MPIILPDTKWPNGNIPTKNTARRYIRTIQDQQHTPDLYAALKEYIREGIRHRVVFSDDSNLLIINPIASSRDKVLGITVNVETHEFENLVPNGAQGEHFGSVFIITTADADKGGGNQISFEPSAVLRANAVGQLDTMKIDTRRLWKSTVVDDVTLQFVVRHFQQKSEGGHHVWSAVSMFFVVIDGEPRRLAHHDVVKHLEGTVLDFTNDTPLDHVDTALLMSIPAWV